MSRWFFLCLLVSTATLPTPTSTSHRERRTIGVLARGLANYLGINQPVRQADPVEPLTYPPPVVSGDAKPRARLRATTSTTTSTTTTTTTTSPAPPPDLSALRAALRGLTTPPSTRFPPRVPRVPEFLPIAPADGDPDKKVVLIGIPVALHHLQRLRDNSVTTEATDEQDAIDAEAKKLTQSQNLYKAFSSLLRQVPTRPPKKEPVKEVVQEAPSVPADMTIEEMMVAMQGYEDNYEQYRARIAAKLRMPPRPERPIDSYGEVVQSVHAEEESVSDMMQAMKALEDSYEGYRARVGEKLRTSGRQSTGRPIDSYGNLVPLVKPSRGTPKMAVTLPKKTAKQAVEDRPLAWTFVAPSTTTPAPPKEPAKQSTLSWMFFGDQSNPTPKKQSMLSWMFFGDQEASTTTTTTPAPTAHGDPEIYTNYLDSQMGIDDPRPHPGQTPDFFNEAPNSNIFHGHDASFMNHLTHHRPEPGVVADFHPSSFGRRPGFDDPGQQHAPRAPFNGFFNRDSGVPKGGAFAGSLGGNGTSAFGGWTSPVQLAGVAAQAVDHRGEGGVRQGGVPVYDFASSGVSVAKAPAPTKRRVNRV